MNTEPKSNESLPASPAEGTVESVIAEHPFLRGLSPEHQRLLAGSALRVRFDPDELIFHEGEPANRFYLIEKGRVLLESHLKDEAAVQVQVIGPGDVLGWSWLFPPSFWHFDARASGPVTAIFFYGTRLREQCEQDRDFGFEMMKRMTQVVINRLQATRGQLLAARRRGPA